MGKNSDLEKRNENNMEWLRKLVKIATEISIATLLQEGYIAHAVQKNEDI